MGLPACQPAPSQFAHMPGITNSTIGPQPDVSGITIRPVAGFTKRQSDALLSAMANAFMAIEIPAATSGANRSSKFVEGNGVITTKSGHRSVIQVEWVLTDSLGKMIGKHLTPKFLASGTWQNLNPEMFATLTQGAARYFSRLI